MTPWEMVPAKVDEVETRLDSIETQVADMVTMVRLMASEQRVVVDQIEKRLMGDVQSAVRQAGLAVTLCREMRTEIVNLRSELGVA